MCQESELGIAQSSNPYPKCGDGFATTTTAEKNPVDDGGDQRREVVGGEEDDPETRRGRAGYARAKGFGKFPKIDP